MRPFLDLLNGYTEDGKRVPGYLDQVKTLKQRFPLDNIDDSLCDANEQRDFVNLFSAIIRLRHVLITFLDFENCDSLSENEYDRYQACYNDIRAQATRNVNRFDVDIRNDLEFETELVEWQDIDINYILSAIETRLNGNTGGAIRQFYEFIRLKMRASPSLHSKQKLIEDFLALFDASGDSAFAQQGEDGMTIQQRFTEFARKQFRESLSSVIATLGLDRDNTEKLMAVSFENDRLITFGEQFDSIVTTSLFFAPKANEREEKLKAARIKLQELFDEFREFAPLTTSRQENP